MAGVAQDVIAKLTQDKTEVALEAASRAKERTTGSVETFKRRRCHTDLNAALQVRMCSVSGVPCPSDCIHCCELQAAQSGYFEQYFVRTADMIAMAVQNPTRHALTRKSTKADARMRGVGNLYDSIVGYGDRKAARSKSPTKLDVNEWKDWASIHLMTDQIVAFHKRWDRLEPLVMCHVAVVRSLQRAGIPSEHVDLIKEAFGEVWESARVLLRSAQITPDMDTNFKEVLTGYQSKCADLASWLESLSYAQPRADTPGMEALPSACSDVTMHNIEGAPVTGDSADSASERALASDLRDAIRQSLGRPLLHDMLHSDADDTCADCGADSDLHRVHVASNLLLEKMCGDGKPVFPRVAKPDPSPSRVEHTERCKSSSGAPSSKRSRRL